MVALAEERSIGLGARRRLPAAGVLLALLSIVLVPHAEAASDAVSVLEGATARIHYREPTRALAQTVRDALDFADTATAARFGRPRHKIDVHVHRSTEEMIDALMTISGYDRPTADLIAKVGASPSTRGTMHVHSKTQAWGFMLWHAMVHEYVHGLVEERYGETIAARARWIYEGLGDAEAYRALRPRFGAAEERWSRGRFKLLFRALVSGRRLRLSGLLDEGPWIHNMATSPATWDLQYAEAYAAVTFLIDRYGFVALQELLDRLRAGSSVDGAMQPVLGDSPTAFEWKFVVFIARTGVLDLYGHVTVAVGGLIAMVAAIAGVVVMRRRR